MARSDMLVISKLQNLITSSFKNKEYVKKLFDNKTATCLITRACKEYTAIGHGKIYCIHEKSTIIIPFVGGARKFKAKPAITGN